MDNVGEEGKGGVCSSSGGVLSRTPCVYSRNRSNRSLCVYMRRQCMLSNGTVNPSVNGVQAQPTPLPRCGVGRERPRHPSHHDPTSQPTPTACRKGKGSVFKSHTKLNKKPVKLRKLDYAEKHGYIKVRPSVPSVDPSNPSMHPFVPPSIHAVTMPYDADDGRLTHPPLPLHHRCHFPHPRAW